MVRRAVTIGVLSAGSLEDAFGSLSTSTRDALAHAASRGSNNSSISLRADKADKDDGYGLMDGWHDMCGIAQR